jgi:transposase
LEVFCGIDWAEAHHDVALVDGEGTLIAKRRISDDAAGFAALIMLLADAGDSAEDPIPVAIETSRGLLVACLRATGRRVYAINPMAVSRYRDRYSVARKKSDAADAFVLANILRTDMAAHRPLPADSELAQAIAVLARAQQDAVWERTCAHHKLRSLLREYYPALLQAFTDKRGGLLRPEARALLAAAPTPRAAAKLTITQLAALLRRAGRQRGVDAEAARLQAILRTEYLHQLPLVEDAFAHQAWPCCEHSTPPAPTPTTSPPPPPNILTSTRTPRSSPACQDLDLSPAPGYWPRSATTDPASPTPGPSRPTPEAHP